MSVFSDIPVRANGQYVNYAWFNAIRTALINFLSTYIGAGAIESTEFTIANNTGPSDVTGLSFDGSLYRGAIVDYTIYRKTDDFEYSRCGTIHLAYKTEADSWEYSDSGAGDSDVEFSMDGDQVQYTSSNMTGANYEGKMVFIAKTISI